MYITHNSSYSPRNSEIAAPSPQQFFHWEGYYCYIISTQHIPETNRIPPTQQSFLNIRNRRQKQLLAATESKFSLAAALLFRLCLTFSFAHIK